MFTGIIESTGKVIEVQKEGDKNHYTIESSFTNELKIGESVSHDGVCLTITSLNDEQYTVTAIDTTLETTNINWQAEKVVNLERAMMMNGRLDGQIVQGNVDDTGIVESIEHNDGSILISVKIKDQFNKNIVDKGSICMNGISLTIVDAFPSLFTVAIIPHTWMHTNLHQLSVGDKVNLEFDIIGKYVERMMTSRRWVMGNG